MRRYSTLILSFICSVIIFIVLIVVQTKMVNKSEGVVAYIVSKDVDIYESITSDMLDSVCITLIDGIQEDLIKDVSNLSDYVTKEKITKGKILLKQDVVKKVDLTNYISEQYVQRVIIPLSNVDNGLTHIINDNTFINLYITIDAQYLPSDIDIYMQMPMTTDYEQKVTFLYLEKKKPICFLDENGIISSKEGFCKSVVLELTKEQAMYINYIKGKAGFSITAI